MLQPFEIEQERRETPRENEVELSTVQFGRRVLAVADMEVDEPYEDGTTMVTYYKNNKAIGIMIKRMGETGQVAEGLGECVYSNPFTRGDCLGRRKCQIRAVHLF